ncbi:MAG: HlyD family efflux transporter periplasmic adaptor subunit, partial [Gemmatimonadetes bacterium]|nr:HlyD family efflux transporter periplasmic adaptor subunit [Gemmatimonadota bacterium]
MAGPREPVPVELDMTGLATASLLNRGTTHRAAARWVLGLALAGAAALFLPWQQSIAGEGTVTALRPQDRPQVVPTIIAGRIERWHVQEGEFVTRGTPLVEISEVKDKFLDPELVPRTRDMLDGKRDAVEHKLAKVIALDSLIFALEQARDLSLQKARNKLELYEAAVEAAAVDSAVEADRFARREQLFREGLASKVDLETFRKSNQQGIAKLVEKRQELRNARIEIASIGAEYGEKIAKARADRNATRAEVGEGQAEIAKLRTELASMEIRAGMYVIKAPQDGTVIKALKAGVGETVKENDPLVTIQPAGPQQAVELMVSARDVPLVRPGRTVRLQFDGWPALQFSGWPRVSLGTFGARVRVVDYVSNAKGYYRVLVVPDSADDPWPAQLRMGTRALGW